MEQMKTYFLAKASVVETGEDVDIESIKTYAKVSDDTKLEKQKDLMYIVSILLSIGANKNDDFFLANEILPVRNTGAHKPLNMEHSNDKIVGHIVRTYATLKDGSIVPNSKNPDTDNFDITSEAVMYKFIFPELADEVKQLAKAGKLFVSVEAWFSNFDYLVGTKIVKRNKDTAPILDHHLKANGGDGVFENKKVRRVLRNITIGGQGIVKTPANPTSLIKSVASMTPEFVLEDIKDEIIKNNITEDILYLATAKEKTMDFQDEVIEELAQVIAAQKVLALKTEPDKVEINTIPEVKALIERVSALESGNKDLKEKVNAFEAKEEIGNRKAQLKKMGLSDSFIEANEPALSCVKENFDAFIKLLGAAISDSKPQKAINTELEVKEVKEAEVVKSDESTEIEEDGQDEDVITIEELELVDKEIKIETDGKSGSSPQDIISRKLSQLMGSKSNKWLKIFKK